MPPGDIIPLTLVVNEPVIAVFRLWVLLERISFRNFFGVFEWLCGFDFDWLNAGEFT